MAKYTYEQICELSVKAYGECENMIMDIANALKDSVDKNFNVNNTMVCFDFVLQCCLLGAAVKDGKLEHTERYFVENITKYGDLMALINSEMAKKFSDWRTLAWDEISSLDSQTQQNMVNAAYTMVEPYAKNFVDLFAAADKILTDVNVRDMLYNKVGMLFVAIAGVDGDDLNCDVARDEGAFAFYLYDELIEKAWKAITNE